MWKNTITESTNVFFHLSVISGFIFILLYNFLSLFFAFMCFTFFTDKFLI